MYLAIASPCRATRRCWACGWPRPREPSSGYRWSPSCATGAWSLFISEEHSAASRSSSTLARPTSIADVAGTYVATLIVNDSQIESASSTVNFVT